jgi:hypothetical protein
MQRYRLSERLLRFERDLHHGSVSERVRNQWRHVCCVRSRPGVRRWSLCLQSNLLHERLLRGRRHLRNRECGSVRQSWRCVRNVRRRSALRQPRRQVRVRRDFVPRRMLRRHGKVRSVRQAEQHQLRRGGRRVWKLRERSSLRQQRQMRMHPYVLRRRLLSE